jgi:Ethylbenzene dehydrogenase
LPSKGLRHAAFGNADSPDAAHPAQIETLSVAESTANNPHRSSKFSNRFEEHPQQSLGRRWKMRSKGIRRFHWWAAVVAALLVATVAPGAFVDKTHADGGGASVEAAFASPTIDGNAADWAAIPGLNVTLEQLEIPAGSDWEYDAVDPVNAVLKVANDGDNIYVLFEVTDSYDYVADDAGLSPALGVMFLIDPAAGPHMGSADEDLEEGLGMVDIWHWELDCGPGALSGVGPAGSGNDPDCNLDDEYATDPETREDDDGAGAENSLVGSWTHSASTIGADGTWTFEMSRPLNTGDATDAQFATGGTANLALAYWDPKETVIGWSDAGHLVSSDLGWIEVHLATQDAPVDDTPTTGTDTTPAPPAVGNAGLAQDSGDGGFPVGGAVIAGMLIVAIVATVIAFSLKRNQA